MEVGNQPVLTCSAQVPARDRHFISIAGARPARNVLFSKLCSSTVDNTKKVTCDYDCGYEY